MPCFKDTASFTNIDAKVPALMPQGLVPVIISLLRLAAAAHEGTKDCPHYLHFVLTTVHAITALKNTVLNKDQASNFFCCAKVCVFQNWVT